MDYDANRIENKLIANFLDKAKTFLMNKKKHKLRSDDFCINFLKRNTEQLNSRVEGIIIMIF